MKRKLSGHSKFCSQTNETAYPNVSNVLLLTLSAFVDCSLFVCLFTHMFAWLFVFYVCMYVCLSACLSVCLACLSICLSVCLFCMSVGVYIISISVH